MRRILLALVAGCLLAGSAGAYTIDVRHPRLLIHPDSVDAIRARCLTGKRAALYTKNKITTGSLTNAERVYYWAFYGLVEQDTAYVGQVRRSAMWATMAASSTELGINIDFRGPPWAIFYDWCYDLLTEGQRDTLEAYLLRAGATLHSSDNGAASMGYSVGYRPLLYGLPIAGGELEGADHTLALSWVDRGIVKWNQWLACHNEMAGGGTISYYPGHNAGTAINALLSLQNSVPGAITEDLDGWWANHPKQWVGASRSKATGMTFSRAQGRYNYALAPYNGMLAVAGYLGNEDAQAMANNWADWDSTLGYTTADGKYATFLLFNNPSWGGKDVSGVSRYWIDDQRGWYQWRSATTIGYVGNTDRIFSYLGGHQMSPGVERAGGVWWTSRGNDDLFIHGGYFKDSDNQAYSQYVGKTIGRNGILLYDADASGCSDCTDNVGNMSFGVNNRSDLWPDCDPISSLYYTGYSDTLAAGAGVDLCVWSNVQPGYSTRATAVNRRMTLTHEGRFILLEDMVVPSSTMDGIWSLWHMYQSPTVASDGYNTLLGGSRGGVYQHTGATSFSVTRGSSGAVCYLLAHTLAGAEVRVIGGRNPNRLPQMQNVADNGKNYTSDAGLISYDYYIETSEVNRAYSHSGFAWSDTSNALYAAEPSGGGMYRVQWGKWGEVPADTVRSLSLMEIGESGLATRTVTTVDHGNYRSVVLTDTDSTRVWILPEVGVSPWSGGLQASRTYSQVSALPVAYIVGGLTPNTSYAVSLGGAPIDDYTASAGGVIRFALDAGSGTVIVGEGDPPPSGACCALDGSCTVTVEAECAGTWQGADPDCDPNPCEQPTGACCYPDGSCQVTLAGGCAGDWTMFGICAPNPCPQPPAEADRRHSRRVVRRWIEEGR